MLPVVSRTPLTIRPAVSGDYAFIDRLQAMHSKGLGFMRTEELEEHLRNGHVLIAEDATRLPIGYCISVDRYFKRDDVGVVYQMNVSPGSQRKLVAATLLSEVFDRAAYGCRLFSCWCAQDLEANHFWESMGFVPLAFRTGAVSKKKVRTHIFWQKRIREGDVSTPYWYPCKTDGGHLRAHRIVLPIPPGVHWSDEMPVLIPEAQLALPDASDTVARAPRSCRKHSISTGERIVPQEKVARLSGVSFTPPAPAKPARIKKPKLPKAKADPALIAKARELRDRWLEQVNAGAYVLEGAGKYDVTRRLLPAMPEPLALPAAA